jgi:protein-tyrosine phosphatase
MPPPPRSRSLELPGVPNVRDLGGLPLASGATTAWRCVLRGSCAAPWPAAAEAALWDEGVTAVIDLRTPDEAARRPGPLAGRGDAIRMNVPLLSPEVDVDPRILAEGTLRDVYRAVLDIAGDAFVAFVETLAGLPPTGVLIHCQGGKDRTGLVSALLLRLAGVADDAIAADFALSGVHLAGYLAERRAARLARGEDPERFDVLQDTSPTTLLAALQHLDEAHGGALAYLRRHGCADASARRAADRLLLDATYH